MEYEEEDDFWNSLGGSTEAYNKAHVIARIELISRIAELENYQQLWDEWAANVGILEPILACERVWERLQELLGDNEYYRWRRHMEESEGDTSSVYVDVEDPDKAKVISTEVNGLIKTADAAADVLLARMNEVNNWDDSFIESIISLVKNDLHLPWSWVAYELFQLSIRIPGVRAKGEISIEIFWTEKIQYPAPELSFVFDPIPEETAEEQSSRFAREVSIYRDQVDAISSEIAVPAGQRRDPEKIAQYIGWMFRNRVLSESILGISEYEKDGKKRVIPVDRSHVRYGINQAVGLLGVAGQFWNDASEDDIALAKRFWVSTDGEGKT